MTKLDVDQQKNMRDAIRDCRQTGQPPAACRSSEDSLSTNRFAPDIELCIDSDLWPFFRVLICRSLLPASSTRLLSDTTFSSNMFLRSSKLRQNLLAAKLGNFMTPFPRLVLHP